MGALRLPLLYLPVVLTISTSIALLAHFRGQYPRGASYDIDQRIWVARPTESVHLSLEPYPVHYNTSMPLGNTEWDALLPSGGGFLYLGDDRRQHSISMFHELRCLGIIADSLARREQDEAEFKPSALDVHCMNYIRQMVLCRSDTRLEPVRSVVKLSGNTVPDVTHECKDWTVLYTAAEENYSLEERES